MEAWPGLCDRKSTRFFCLSHTEEDPLAGYESLALCLGHLAFFFKSCFVSFQF